MYVRSNLSSHIYFLISLVGWFLRKSWTVSHTDCLFIHFCSVFTAETTVESSPGCSGPLPSPLKPDDTFLAAWEQNNVVWRPRKQVSIVKSSNFRDTQTWFQISAPSFSSLWTWRANLTSLSLRVPVHEMGRWGVISTLGSWANSMRWWI